VSAHLTLWLSMAAALGCAFFYLLAPLRGLLAVEALVQSALRPAA
jgi:hypothetical protein